MSQYKPENVKILVRNFVARTQSLGAAAGAPDFGFPPLLDILSCLLFEGVAKNEFGVQKRRSFEERQQMGK